MKKLIATLCLLSAAFGAVGQTNVLSLYVGDYSTNVQPAVDVTLTLVSPNPRTMSNFVVRQDPVTHTTDNTGYVAWTNVLWGKYVMNVGGVGTAYVFTVGTNTTGAWNIPALIAAPGTLPPNPATNYYTQADVNALLAGLSLSFQTPLTNTVNGSNYSLTNLSSVKAATYQGQSGASSLAIGSPSTLNSDFTVSGDFTAQTLNATAGLTVSGMSTLNNNLKVTTSINTTNLYASNIYATNFFGGTFNGAFVGNGAGLTNLPATNASSTVFGVVKVDNSTIVSAGGIILVGLISGGAVNSGTVADARLSANVLLAGGSSNEPANSFFANGTGSSAAPSFSTNHSIILNSATAQTFTGSHVGNGAGLTNLNATELRSGTVADALLNTNLGNFVTNFTVNTNGDMTMLQLNGNNTAGQYLNLNPTKTDFMRYIRNHDGAGHGETALVAGHDLHILAGQDGQHSSSLLIGASAPGPQGYADTIFFQYDSHATATNIGGYSHMVDFVSPYWTGSTEASAYTGIRSTAMNTNGGNALEFYNPVTVLNPLINQSPGTLQMDIFTDGILQNGKLIQQLATASPGATYGLSFDDPPVSEVNISSAVTISVTAGTHTNSYVKRRLLIRPGTSAYGLTFPTNFIWVSESGTQIAPTNVPASTILSVTVEQLVNSATNYYANYRLGPYTPVYDTNAQNFFNAIGGGLTAAETNAVNTAIVSAKSLGVWSLWIDWHPLVGGNSNSCSWNAKDTNKYRMAWNGSSATNFTANGIYGDGVGFYGQLTGLKPSTEITSQNSSMMGVWVRGPATPTAGGAFYGVVGSGGNERWGARVSGTSARFSGMNVNVDNTIELGASGNFAGFVGENCTASTTQQSYLNGTASGGTGKNASTALPAGIDVNVLARAFFGFSPDSFSNANLTSVIVAQNMTAQNMTDTISILTAFNNALGR